MARFVRPSAVVQAYAKGTLRRLAHDWTTVALTLRFDKPFTVMGEGTSVFAELNVILLSDLVAHARAQHAGYLRHLEELIPDTQDAGAVMCLATDPTGDAAVWTFSAEDLAAPDEFVEVIEDGPPDHNIN